MGTVVNGEEGFPAVRKFWVTMCVVFSFYLKLMLTEKPNLGPVYVVP